MNMSGESKPADPVSKDSAGIRTASRIMEQWGLDADAQSAIMGIERNSFSSLIRSPVTSSLTKDQRLRISYVLNMYSALKSIFNNPDNVNGFMAKSNNNDFFAGRSPNEVLGSGSFEDLERVAKHVESLKNIW